MIEFGQADLSQTNKLIIRNLGLFYHTDSSVPNQVKFNFKEVKDHGAATEMIPMCGPMWTFGYNTYSIYGGGVSAKQVNGYFNPAAPTTGNASYIHPTYVVDTTGKLESGHTFVGLSKDSSNYTVGSGTFKNGGAIGCTFYFPMNFTITEKSNEPPVITEDHAANTTNEAEPGTLIEGDAYRLLAKVTDPDKDDLNVQDLRVLFFFRKKGEKGGAL